MELKVWVEGIQRVVCGVCDRTTCQDVVYALAHATGKTGRFTLIERWRNNERLLAPHEHPLKVLMKWGEYSSDVHFILQRTALDSSGGINNNKNNASPPSVVSPGNNKTVSPGNNKTVSPINNKTVSSRPTKTSVDPLHGFTPPVSSSLLSPSNKADLKKSLTFSGGRPSPSDSPQSRDNGERRLNVGVVRGIPQQHPYQTEMDEGDEIIAPFTPPRQNGLEMLFHSPSVPQPPQYHQQQQPLPAIDTGHLVYPRYEPPYGRIVNNSGGTVEPSPPPSLHPAQYSSPRDTFGDQKQDSIRFPPPYRDPPQPFISGGASNRQPPPPPYREPPRPSRASGLSPAGYRSSPAPSPSRMCSGANSSNNSTSVRPVSSVAVEDDPSATPGAASDVDVTAHRRSTRRNLKLDLNSTSYKVGNGKPPSPPPSDPVTAQLIQKINRQRGSLDEKQDQLGHIEQELVVWEERLQRRLEEERQRLTKEWVQLEERCRQQDHQLSDLRDVEEEWERVCREGREMTEELGRWRADVSSAEARIDQCGSTLRTLRIDVTAAEERLTSELESEMARIKADLEAAAREEQAIDEEARRADEDVAESNERLQGMRTEIDYLTQEIKQANLQSLSIAPADDLKVLLEGSYKSGHSRRMLGSPRQLENPVPTNKNPHGVWV